MPFSKSRPVTTSPLTVSSAVPGPHVSMAGSPIPSHTPEAPTTNELLFGSRSNTPVIMKSGVNQQTTSTANRSGVRKRRLSENFYEEGGTEDQSDNFRGSEQAETAADQIKKFQTRQSKKLPHWAWRILMIVIGVKQNPSDRIIVGHIILAMTVVLAVVCGGSYIWYTVYDVYSQYTKSNAMTGSVSILLVLFYLALGIYANRLLRNLFRSKKLVESVRLHSKTVFKVSASFLLVVLGVIITVLNNLDAQESYSDEHCQNITLSVYVCRTVVFSRVCYSIVALVWNLLVGFIVLSVCRTHTIGIRRFIRELEEDGKVYEALFRQEIIEQLQKSGDFPAAAVINSTSCTDSEASDAEQEPEDEWAEDDPLSSVLTLRPRSSAAFASIAAATGAPDAGAGSRGWSVVRKRMLRRQSSVSNNSIHSRTHSDKSSRRNSASSQENDVFQSQSPTNGINTAQRTSFERHHYPSSPMATLVEQSTETLDSSAGNKPPQEIKPPHYDNDTTLIKLNSNDQQKVQTSYDNLNNTERNMNGATKDCDLIDISAAGGTQEVRMDRVSEWKSSQEGNSNQSAHTYEEADASDSDTNDKSFLLKSVKDQSKKKSDSKVHKKLGEKNKLVKKKSSDKEHKKVDVGKVIQSMKGRVSVDGKEREAKDKILNYVSDLSSENEDMAPSSQHVPHMIETKADDSHSQMSWAEDSPLLTNDEILLAYWKISCRLRSTSLALQRWLCMWITFILIWSGAFLVQLVTHDSKIVEIAQFMLTILLIPLICSAYGEINYEGQRMIKSICPVTSRMDMLFLLNEMPLQLTAFGFAVNYSSIVTTVGALGLAFFTKLILDDISW